MCVYICVCLSSGINRSLFRSRSSWRIPNRHVVTRASLLFECGADIGCRYAAPIALNIRSISPSPTLLLRLSPPLHDPSHPLSRSPSQPPVFFLRVRLREHVPPRLSTPGQLFPPPSCYRRFSTAANGNKRSWTRSMQDWPFEWILTNFDARIEGYFLEISHYCKLEYYESSID